MLDRMRETLFNILQLEVPGAVFADLYAGTGAVGIEALSRGAERAYFVENDPKAARVIEENLRALGAREDAVVRLGDVARALPDIEADIWFLGPPYAAEEQYLATLSALGERGAKLVIAQHGKSWAPPERFGTLRKSRVAPMGANVLSFYRPEASSDED